MHIPSVIYRQEIHAQPLVNSSAAIFLNNGSSRTLYKSRRLRGETLFNVGPEKAGAPRRI